MLQASHPHSLGPASDTTKTAKPTSKKPPHEVNSHSIRSCQRGACKRVCPIRCCVRVRNYAARTGCNAVHNKRTRRARPRSAPKKVTVIDRAEITVGYLHACGDLETFLALAGDAELRSRSAGTRWTNEELLFHMVFGYMVTRRLLPLVKCFGRLPPSVGNAFAGLL